MASAEVDTTLQETAKLAHDIGINGTPGFVYGGKVVTGASGLKDFESAIGVPPL